MPCRVDPQIKSLIGQDAEAKGLSQSRWLEEAIAEKLQRQGYAVELPKGPKAPVRKPRRPRRMQRPSIPAPEKSPDASVNRADQSTTMRVGKSLMARIDKARGKKNRSTWMNEAIAAFLGENAELPEVSEVREVQSEPIALRLDREVVPEISAAARNSGMTNTEWFRRVARWYLERDQ